MHDLGVMRRAAVALLVLLTLTGAASARGGRALRGRAKTHADFDWDGNLFRMPTRVYLKKEGGEHPITTHEYVRHGHEVGQPGRWAHLSIDPDPLTGTWRDLRDQPGRNIYLDETRLAVARGDFGPEWEAFVRATSTRRGANRTGIITARSQSRESGHAVLLWLAETGLIRHAPPLRNVFTVNSPGFRIPRRKVPESRGGDRKVMVMRHRLDAIQRKRPTTLVLDPEGTGWRRMHIYRFSDDYIGNFARAVEALSAEVARWPDVKILVRFSDPDHPHEKARTVVLLPGGGSRPATELD